MLSGGELGLPAVSRLLRPEGAGTSGPDFATDFHIGYQPAPVLALTWSSKTLFDRSDSGLNLGGLGIGVEHLHDDEGEIVVLLGIADPGIHPGGDPRADSGTLMAAKSAHAARGGASGSRRRWTSDARAMSRRSVSCSTTRLDEIRALAAAGVCLALPLRTRTEILGVLLLGKPSDRVGFIVQEKQALRAGADQR